MNNCLQCNGDFGKSRHNHKFCNIICKNKYHRLEKKLRFKRILESLELLKKQIQEVSK